MIFRRKKKAEVKADNRIRSYSQLPLGKYQQIMQIFKEEDREDIDRQVSIIAILNDLPEDEVLNMPIADFSALSEASTFLYLEKPQFKGKVTDKVIMDGQTYCITKGVNELTTAQYIDFQAFATDVNKNIVSLLSIFIIPEGKKYNEGYDIIDVQRIIRENLTAPHATAILGFFLKRLRLSVSSILIYLGYKMKKRKKRNLQTLMMMKDLRTNLQRIGDGLRLSI